MYDENGQVIQRGNEVVATKTVSKVTRIYEGKVVGLRPKRPNVLVRIVNTGKTLWFDNDLTAVQLTDEQVAKAGL